MVEAIQEESRRELVYLKRKVFELAEKARKDLGLSRSGFYRFCVIRTLQELGYLEKIHEVVENVPTP